MNWIMSSETVVRQCERCDLTEGTVLCQECAGKEGITVELKRRDFKYNTAVVHSLSVQIPSRPPAPGLGLVFVPASGWHYHFRFLDPQQMKNIFDIFLLSFPASEQQYLKFSDRNTRQYPHPPGKTFYPTATGVNYGVCFWMQALEYAKIKNKSPMLIPIFFHEVIMNQFICHRFYFIRCAHVCCTQA